MTDRCILHAVVIGDRFSWLWGVVQARQRNTGWYGHRRNFAWQQDADYETARSRVIVGAEQNA